MSFKNDTPVLAVPHESLYLAKKIVIVDGMIGGGKNLISSIVSSLPNVEMWLAKPEIEHVCALNHLGHISLDAAKTLINMWVDEEIYNQSMSRNTNFKPSDHSSVFNTSRPLRYFKRLFKSPSEVTESIKKEMPVLNLMTHVNTSYSKPLFEALGERLIYIRVSRHPMSEYMLKHNKRWNERWTIDDRHGPILYKTHDQSCKSIHLPFYAKNIEKMYLEANSTDRAILLFDQWIRNSDDFIDKVKKSTKAIIFEIPYEKFVFQPETYIKKIASSLGVTPDNVTNNRMRRERVPRNSLTNAPKNKIYSKIGWESPKKNLTLAENFAVGRAYAAETASPEALSILDKLAEDYEERHNINK
jgi:hypothetical protein